MKKEVKLPAIIGAVIVLLCLLLGMGWYFTRPPYQVVESRSGLVMKDGHLVFRNPNGNGQATSSRSAEKTSPIH